MLDLHRLEILQRFRSLGSIAAAAAELGYSSSAVSQQLATLEREAGVALIERTARSANLTAAGRDLAEQADFILGAVEYAQNLMRERAGTISGSVEIHCIPGLAALLAPDFAQLQDDHAGLQILAREQRTNEGGVSALHDGAADLVVTDDWSQREPVTPSGLTLSVLRREPVVLAVGEMHEAAVWIDEAPLSTASLRKIIPLYTWLSAPIGKDSRTAADDWLTRLSVEPRRRWEFEGLDVLAAVVATGAGIALLPETIARSNPDIVSLELKPDIHRSIVGLTRTTSQRDPAISACLAVARAAVNAQDRALAHG
jgi:DNA-binding transcriptional LysR family regulator